MLRTLSTLAKQAPVSHDYTAQFDIFCEVFAEEVNYLHPLDFQVTKEEVKSMPEAINAFFATK